MAIFRLPLTEEAGFLPRSPGFDSVVPGGDPWPEAGLEEEPCRRGAGAGPGQAEG